MSKVLFLVSDFPENGNGNIYVDLVNEFVANGHEVDVATPLERRYNSHTHTIRSKKLNVVYYKTLNFRGKVNLLEKGIATILMGWIYCFVVNKYFADKQYDILICATMPITYAPVMKMLKRKYDTKTYLLQKDFFPQSAVDLGLLHKSSLIYKIFRHIEKSLFNASDYIGVISPKNIEYFINDNKDELCEKLEVCPNSIIPNDDKEIELLKLNKKLIRNKYNIPQEDIIFIYGGNISRAQGIEFIKEFVARAGELIGGYLLFVGNGNHFNDLRNFIDKKKLHNVQIISYLQKADYDKLLAACDVGLVFLDKRFTIANVPSRTLSHLNMGQPILAATDSYTDYKAIIEKNKLGIWVSSDDIEKFINSAKIMINNSKLRIDCGINARKYLLDNCTANHSYSIIIKHICKGMV